MKNNADLFIFVAYKPSSVCPNNGTIYQSNFVLRLDFTEDGVIEQWAYLISRPLEPFESGYTDIHVIRNNQDLWASDLDKFLELRSAAESKAEAILADQEEKAKEVYERARLAHQKLKDSEEYKQYKRLKAVYEGRNQEME